MNIEILADQIEEISLEIVRKEETIDTERKAIAGLKDLVDDEMVDIEKQVLFNSEYKNDSQRKLAIKELADNSEELRRNKSDIQDREEKIIDLEFEIKRLKISKTHKETLLKLAFIQLEKAS